MLVGKLYTPRSANLVFAPRAAVEVPGQAIILDVTLSFGYPIGWLKLPIDFL